MNQIELRHIKEHDLESIWRGGFRQEEPEWSKYNGPYFEDYRVYMSLNEFHASNVAEFLLSDRVCGIWYQGRLVGMVSRYWESLKTRWMEIGIIIYDETVWGQGVGHSALRQWITQTFVVFPELQHLGLTTWSGNPGMIRLSEKLGLNLEARIPQVRYWQGTYYDSVKYGILRDDWEALNDPRRNAHFRF